jgi:hypothetical protein
MKINVLVKLKDIDGTDIIPTANAKPMTLKDVIFNSILSPSQDDDEKKKYEKYEIFKKVKEAGKDGLVELKAEEITTIKKSIGKVQPPLVLGQAFDLLEGKQ